MDIHKLRREIYLVIRKVFYYEDSFLVDVVGVSAEKLVEVFMGGIMTRVEYLSESGKTRTAYVLTENVLYWHQERISLESNLKAS